MTPPVEAVWAVLRDFNGHDQWHPAVADSHIERGYSSDKIGCVRRFHLVDGSELREQLLTLSDADMAFSYCLMETPVPLLNYVAHVRLAPVTDGDRTFWHWQCRFDTPAGPRRRSCATWWPPTSIAPVSRRCASTWGSPALAAEPGGHA